MSTVPNAIRERDYFRVDTELPLRIKPVREEERARLEGSILQREPVDVEGLDPQLALWLDRIESKIDNLIVHLGLDFDGVRPTRPVAVTLSGGGISVPSPPAESGHSLHLVDFELPGSPARSVRALGEVVANRKTAEGNPAIALRFTAITAEDRDAIVRFTLDVERSRVRSRAERRDT